MSDTWKKQLIEGWRYNQIREFGYDCYVLRKVMSNTELDELYDEQTILSYSIGLMKCSIKWPQNVPVIGGLLFQEDELPIYWYPERALELDANNYKVSISIDGEGTRYIVNEDYDKVDWQTGRSRKTYTLVPDRNEDKLEGEK